MLWLGIPAGWLWVLSRTADSYIDAALGTMAASAPTMIIWGGCLQRINKAYLQLAHSHKRSPPSSDRQGQSQPSLTLLDLCMIASVILALALTLAWVILNWGPGHGAGPGAW